MKNVLFLLVLGLASSMSLTAQDASPKKSCEKTCVKKCTKGSANAGTTSETKVASAIMTAEQAAEADPSVEMRKCSMSGNVSYYQKSVCSHSGKVSWAEVSYDQDQGQFTQVASAEMERVEEVKADESVLDVKKTDQKQGM